eukprot:TRINITY_DN13159_c0_g1_i1.p1 TRINITY_DN13159_c0_g1~~TRINITY_DN13159_c0_g1_i1.p1  ORF type:complete len:363 (-),score=72.56 TRINITY_DN13159_c0_g1_i1:89-1075(-)
MAPSSLLCVPLALALLLLALLVPTATASLAGSYKESSQEAPYYICNELGADGVEYLLVSFTSEAKVGIFKGVVTDDCTVGRGTYHTEFHTGANKQTGHMEFIKQANGDISLNRYGTIGGAYVVSELTLELISDVEDLAKCRGDSPSASDVAFRVPSNPEPEEWGWPQFVADTEMTFEAHSGGGCIGSGTPRNVEFRCDSQEYLSYCNQGEVLWFKCTDCDNEIGCSRTTAVSLDDNGCLDAGSFSYSFICSDVPTGNPAPVYGTNTNSCSTATASGPSPAPAPAPSPAPASPSTTPTPSSTNGNLSDASALSALSVTFVFGVVISLLM